ncbi:hypothetical protein SAMN05192529_109163 [Arachidicoccus rhizosphaerae]|uniref:Uncharacterized protein n=1 Tax=Arachidicoccus rhizosphaerae TaxID=551991 RepID=A0A1H3Z012_9BACT|nr:hypothetical protein SAMN05192529_109163 [Arachidicoccus rhizosphaerae]
MSQISVLWAYVIYLPVAIWLTLYVTGKLFDNAIVLYDGYFPRPKGNGCGDQSAL